MALLSLGPPKIAVLPSADRSIEAPKPEVPVSPFAVSGCGDGIQVELMRVYTHTAPSPALSPGPPMNAVLPSDDRPTAVPNALLFVSLGAKVGEIFGPCWVQFGPDRVNTQAAPPVPVPPAPRLPGPPISAVLPSADTATLSP